MFFSPVMKLIGVLQSSKKTYIGYSACFGFLTAFRLIVEKNLPD